MELESTKKQLFTKIYNLCSQSSSYFISTNNFVVSEDKVYQRKQNSWVEYEFNNLEYVFKKIPYIDNICKNLDQYKNENESMFLFVFFFAYYHYLIMLLILLCRTKN